MISASNEIDTTNQKPKRNIFVAVLIIAIMVVVFGMLAWYLGLIPIKQYQGESHPTTEQLAAVHEAEREIEISIDINKDIAIQIDDAIAVIEDQKSNGIVTSYEVSYDSITVRYSVGITYLFQAVYPGVDVMAASYETGKILVVMTPKLSTIGDMSLHEGIIQANNTLISTGDYNNSHYEGTQVTLDFLKYKLSNEDIVIWSGHGGFSARLGPTLLTGAKISSNNENWEDLYEERILENSSGYYIITSKFFDYYYSNGDFSDTLFFFSSCHTGESREIIDSLMSKGASTVLAFDFTVLQEYANDMESTFFKELIIKDRDGNYVNTAYDALSLAWDEHGLSDYDDWGDMIREIFTQRERGAMLTIFGDRSYMLGKQSEPQTKDFEDNTPSPSPEKELGALAPEESENNSLVGDFSIVGKWKSIGVEGVGQAQPGAIIIFTENECNLFSPRDKYALYWDGSTRRLDATGLLGGTLKCVVVVVDNDNIELHTGAIVTNLKRVG